MAKLLAGKNSIIQNRMLENFFIKNCLRLKNPIFFHFFNRIIAQRKHENWPIIRHFYGEKNGYLIVIMKGKTQAGIRTRDL